MGRAWRHVVVADAFTWLPEQRGDAVVAVLPDMAEIGMADAAEYRGWLARAGQACLEAATGPTVFVQTDRRVAGTQVSKAAVLVAAAEQLGRPLLWHRIALRRDVGRIDLRRPGYSHILAFGPGRPGAARPDVILGGKPVWPNGVGIETARFVVSYLHELGTRSLLNPFCGEGTLLAVANAAGIVAYGCDLDEGRVRAAQRLELQGGLF